MTNLLLNTRPDEQFHVQQAQPVPKQWVWGPFRRTSWSAISDPDGATGWFVSWWVWKLQWYHGSVKCDGTRTIMLNNGQLGDPTTGYVMTTTPTELVAVRWRSQGPGDAVWFNMGGS
jgi:hypothetical protein